MTVAPPQVNASFLKRHRRRLVVGAVVALLVGAMAWQYDDQRYPSWYEEVRLSDGRVITIHQKHEYYDNYGTNQSWVEIDLPELGGKRVWHSYLKPMRVDVERGAVYVFGRPRGDRQYYHYGDPKNFLVGFVWNGAEFSRLPFLNIPESLRREENVFPCVPLPTPKLLSAKTKEEKWCPATGDRKQFTRKIDLTEFQALAIQYSRLAGGKPSSD